MKNELFWNLNGFKLIILVIVFGVKYNDIAIVTVKKHRITIKRGISVPISM